jgi:PhnB protein
MGNGKDAVNMAIQPYLFFGGRCEEALGYYQKALGAKVDVVMHFNECPEPMPEGTLAPGFEKKVMHASFRIRGTTLMASDGMGEGEGFSGFSLSLSVKDEADAKQVFAALIDGGSVLMPLSKTFYSPCFGMVTDRFGISWMVIVPAEMDG